ncbi:MAG: hypothetical protein P1U44_10935 [Vicingaceae bacterium]|nr:hypothetical protein [Vicingaceae bacterium]
MIDEKIEYALKQAVQEAGQPEELATKLITWLENVADGNESLTNTNQYTERCSICFDAVNLKEE